MDIQIFIVFSIIYRIYALPIGIGCSIGCSSAQNLDCLDYRQMGHTQSGVYRVIPPEMQRGYDVFCDMTTDGGGWTVFQRRVDGSEDFDREWIDYELDFGDIEGEHWLGFIPLSRIMSTGFFELRIDLEGWQNDTKYASYKEFSINFANNYKLKVMGYSGTAGDSMNKSNGMMFSTRDNDNDKYLYWNCAELRKGPWWYDDCAFANLNGKYYEDGAEHTDGVFWQTWNGGIRRNYTNVRRTEMKIRRL